MTPTTYQVDACSWKLIGEPNSSPNTPHVDMEVDWGGKLIDNSMVDWGTHETHPNEHNISEVDWGGHGSSSNHMTEFLLSEGDWGHMTQVSSFFW